jgi:rapamycin-insensitive companion of mTOR
VAASVAGGSTHTPVSLDKIFLDSVTYKVQILPQKYKIIKTPVHLYGELVKTEEGTQYLKQSNDIEFFK